MARNIDANNDGDWKTDTKVQLEVYIDRSLFSQGATLNPVISPSGGDWELVHTHVDDGNWSTGYGTWATPPAPGMIPQYSTDKSHALTWPNWSVYYRCDEMLGPQYLKWFSVREVAPIPT